MGLFLARRTVKKLTKAGIGSVGAKVLVLGLTFKEDTPDLRNSRVPNIISELHAYGCKVLVHDPCCDAKEAEEEFNISIVGKIKNLPKVSAVILAVAHKYYRQWSIDEWLDLMAEVGIILDIKGIVPRAITNNSLIRLWRL